MAPAIAAKRVELLKEAIPGLSRLLLLHYPPDPIDVGQVRECERTAGTLGVSLARREVRSPADIAPAFEADPGRSQGVVVTTESIFFVHRKQVLELVAKKAWPGIFPFREYVEGGGLMYYGHSYDELYRRAAIYVDRILKGAKPADLPVEQSTQFDLIVNLRTAKALGITIPQSVLQRASEVIE
jgi:putative ABC transport system substrate-binding protein